MALSMDEQRMLAEIEARLSAEDPGLAARLSSFRRPSPAAKLRSPRGRVVGSLFAVALAVVISLMVYAMIPFRAQSPGKQISPVASGNPAASAPVRPPLKPATATTATTKTGAAASAQHTTEASGATAKDKTGAGKTSTGKGTTMSTTKSGTSTTAGSS